MDKPPTQSELKALPHLPLEGVRIVAVEQYGAGPWGTMHLADMGAEIIKIENPNTGGDVARSVPPYTIDRDSVYFQSFNRNKKSITLNLQSPRANEILHPLVARDYVLLKRVEISTIHYVSLVMARTVRGHLLRGKMLWRRLSLALLVWWVVVMLRFGLCCMD